MNQIDTVPHGTFLRSKQTVTVAIEFLNWLHDHGITLEQLRQEHLDAWLADGPTTRRLVDRFIPWAIKCRLVGPELRIARHRRGTSPKLPKSEQDAAVERVVHTDELNARDRAAGILVIVFGQHIEDVIQLTWDNVTFTDDVVTVRLGRTEFALPPPWTSPCANSQPHPATTSRRPTPPATGSSAATRRAGTSTARACDSD